MRALVPNSLRSQPVFEKKEFESVKDFLNWFVGEAEEGIKIKKILVEATIIRRYYSEVDIPDEVYEKIKKKGRI